MSRSLVSSTGFLMAITGILFVVSCSPADKVDDEVVSIAVYYLPWYSTTTLPLRCADLVAGTTPMTPYKITVSDPNEIHLWVKVLDTISLKKWVGSFPGDCRICCIFGSRAGTELRSMALWPTGVTINDRVYEKNVDLITLVRPHLPEDYFQIRRAEPHGRSL